LCKNAYPLAGGKAWFSIRSTKPSGSSPPSFGLEGGAWGVISDLNNNLVYFGYAVVGIFLLSWIISVAVYRARGYDKLAVG
jgi:hypothetical protein